MLRNTAEAIQDAAASEPGEIKIEIRDYSGRGMTFAIVSDSHNDVMLAIAAACGRMEPDSEELIEFKDDCYNFRIDNMGKGIVVY